MNGFASLRSKSTLTLLLGVLALTGCPGVGFGIPCECTPEILPFSESTLELEVSEIRDRVATQTEATVSSWPGDPRSPFYDITDMSAFWEDGRLIVDYQTEEGEFRVTFEAAEAF